MASLTQATACRPLNTADPKCGGRTCTCLQVTSSCLGPLRDWHSALLATTCCSGCSEQASAAAAGTRLVAWISRSNSWKETVRGCGDALPRRHGHGRSTNWPDSPRGSLTVPLAAPGARPIWALRVCVFVTLQDHVTMSACSSPTAPGSSCTRVAESITHASYNWLATVPGPHSVGASVGV